MSVNEIQALTQKFADAFDQRDLQPVMEMRPLLCYAPGALRIRRDHPARLEMEHDYQ